MATGSKVQPPIPPITFSKYERMLETIQYGKDEEVIKLFSSGQFDVNLEVPIIFDDRKKYQVTPLHWAVKYHKPKLCKFLLANGANPYNTLVYEYYPLHEACNRGYDDIVKVFIDAMVDINRVTNDLDTPLHIACTRGNIQCVHLLLGHGANSKMKNKAGHTPLEAALYHNHQDLVQLFTTYGITLDPTISSTSANDKHKVQRRHSFSQTPAKNPKKPPSSIPSKLTNSRPHSFYIDNDEHTSEVVLNSFTGGSLSLLAPTRPTSQTTPPHTAPLTASTHPTSQPSHTTPLTAPSSALSPSSTAQAHTCYGTTASSASTAQLFNTTSLFNSTTVSPASSRPTLMTQLSLASACGADSPSPVERDGIGGAKTWTSSGSRIGMQHSSVSPLYSSQERLANGRSYDDVRNNKSGDLQQQASLRSESFEDCNNTMSCSNSINSVNMTRSSGVLSDHYQSAGSSCPVKEVEAHRTQLERLRSSSTFLQQKKYTTLTTTTTESRSHKQQQQQQQHTTGKRFPVPFAESMSNPEFPLANHYSLKSLTGTERARSHGDLLYSSTGTSRRDFPILPVVQKPPKSGLETKAVSPSREKLNAISHHVCTSLEHNWCGRTATTATVPMTMTSSLSSSMSSMVGVKWNPVYDIIQRILNDIGPKSCSLSQEQIQTIVDSVSSTPILHVTQEEHNHTGTSESSSMTIISLPGSQTVYESCQEGLADLGYVMDERPYKVQFESEGFMALYFRVKRNTHLSSRMESGQDGPRWNQDKSHQLKVIVKLFNLKNWEESSQYHCLVPGTSSCETVPSFQSITQPQAQEVPILKQLSHSPHPNIIQLVSQFKANVGDQYDTFAHNVNPTNPKAMYSTAPTGEFLLLCSPDLKLSKYFEELNKRHNYCIPEAVILHVLAQLLLAIVNLLRHNIAHCAVKPENIYVDTRDRDTILLANLSHSIQLSSLKLNIEFVQRLQQSLNNGDYELAPEIAQSVKDCELENVFSQGNLTTLFSTNDSYTVGRMMYKLLLGESHEFLQRSSSCYTYAQIPTLDHLSPQCNHLLRKLIAYNPAERLSPLDGALGCLVLLFGPRPSQVNTVEDCHQWLLAEAMELYMRPVFSDYSKSSTTTRDMYGGSSGAEMCDSYSKLLCMYLIVAGVVPKKLLTASRFFEEMECTKHS